MNLILHQFKTDLRHFRWQILLLWIAFAVAPVVLMIGLAPESFSLVSVLAMLWQIVGGLFLAVSVVQADPLVGTSAPWLTRPIRRNHLFWSKTLFLLTIILLPRLAFQCVGWLLRGYSTHLMLCAFAESALYSVTVILCAAVLAGVTRNLARFFLALGITVGGIFLWVATVSILVKAHVLERSGTVWTETASLKASKLILAFGVMASCALLAWIAQAYSRRWRFAVAIFAGGLIAFPLITITSKINFLKPRLTAAVPMTLQIVRTNSPMEGQRFFAEMAVQGVPARQIAVAQEMRATLSIDGDKTYLSPDMASYNSYGRLRPARSPQAYNYLKEIEDFFPAKTLWFESGSSGAIGSAFHNQELMNRYNREAPPGELDGSITLDLFEVKNAAEMPLARGSVMVGPGQKVTIRRVVIRDNEIGVTLEESSVILKLDRTPGSDSGYFYDPDPQNTYVLYQPEFGEAYLAVQHMGNHAGADELNGERRLSVRLGFRYSALRERLAGVGASDWLKGARLCVYTPVYRGTASLGFKEENFRWRDGVYAEHQRGSSAAGMKSIESATLPAQPTEVQLRAYLDTILLNAQDNLWNDNVREKVQLKLQSIGTNGLPALLKRLPLSNAQENYLVFPVLRKLANRDHLPDLLAALERDAHLTELFVEKHWEAEALPVLTRMLGDHRHPLLAEALRIVAAAKNPATYADLRWHFVRLESNFYRVISALEGCPEFDLAGAVTEAWNRLNPGRVGDLDIVVAAAKLGSPGALPAAVIRLEEVGNREWLNRTLPQLAEMTGFHGPPTNTVAWLDANLERLRFDSGLHRYVLE